MSWLTPAQHGDWRLEVMSSCLALSDTPERIGLFVLTASRARPAPAASSSTRDSSPAATPLCGPSSCQRRRDGRCASAGRQRRRPEGDADNFRRGRRQRCLRAQPVSCPALADDHTCGRSARPAVKAFNPVTLAGTYLGSQRASSGHEVRARRRQVVEALGGGLPIWVPRTQRPDDREHYPLGSRSLSPGRTSGCPRLPNYAAPISRLPASRLELETA